MQPDVSQKLINLNRQFYQTFGRAFAATRQRVQPGIARLLETLPKHGDWLDLGCGSGSVAALWGESDERQGRYIGLDFSPVLLQEAEEAVSRVNTRNLDIHFQQSDITSMDWNRGLPGMTFDVIAAFAVLHHIPSQTMQKNILCEVKKHLKHDGLLIHSVWQFQHSPRLMSRRLPWGTIGLHEDQVEEGDTLLDWRYALPGQQEQIGLRYVHLFSLDELNILASGSGFDILETFESDGRGGRLGLYQIWQKQHS